MKRQTKSIVRPKPVAKRKQTASISRKIKKTARKTGISLPSFSMNLPEGVKKIISWTTIIIILVGFSFFFLIKGVFFQEKFMIENVKFSQESIDTFEDVELYNDIYNILKGRNYYLLSWFQTENVLAEIQAKYPFIHNFKFQLEASEPIDTGENTNEQTTRGLSAVIDGLISTGEYLKGLKYDSGSNITSLRKNSISTQENRGGTIGLDIEFIEPEFIVKIGEKRFGVRDNKVFQQIDDSKTLGVDKFIVDTPQYVSGVNSMSGFFFEIPFSVFQKVIPMLTGQFPYMERFVYLAGSPRGIVFEGGHAFYLNLLSSEGLAAQFQKYDNLKKYYSGRDEIKVADLSALGEDKVIIRKI